MSGGKKHSVVNGIVGIASKTSAIGGLVAGCEVQKATAQQDCAVSSSLLPDPSFCKLFKEKRLKTLQQLRWDDAEEQRYRDWLREVQQKRDSEAEWTEYEAEASYRAKLRQQAESREDEPISWDDETEQAFRRRYIELRQVFKVLRIVWKKEGRILRGKVA